MMDRAMVTSNVKVYAKEAVPEKEEKVDTAAEQSNSTAENVVFAPSAYGIYGGDSSCSSENLLSWSVAADLSLSQGYYTIKPPGGTGSWAEEPPLPSEYAGAHYSIDPLYISPFFHAHQGELAMSQYSHAPTVTPPHEYAAYRNYWVSDIPALPPSPTDTSPSSSPVTPPGNSMVLHPAATDEGVQCAEPSSNNEVLPRESFTQSGQDEFVTEFRDVLHPLSSERYELRDNTFGTGADVVAREPLIRTSYQDSTAYSSSSRALSTQS
ncbi:hypothetical protein K438DRAFT_1867278 [Mycena galopus ATCC 62051]|nr:hypothetical protein K438DRAFT_1867278 [Mycena galopus ATCC 62051]